MLYQRLQQVIDAQKSLLCIGLDPDIEKLPLTQLDKGGAIFAFCRAIVDATADLVAAYKPQIAYFSAMGAESQLVQLIEYIHARYPDVLVILDAKRGDIDATAKQYAKELFDRYQADVVTLNPYMGLDAITPFLEYRNKGVFMLCKTSNPSADAIQRQIVQTPTGPQPLYRYMAQLCHEWDKNQQMGLVMGATDMAAVQDVRQHYPDVPILAPGVGAQGANMADILRYGRDSQGGGLLINASRSILYASSEADFAQAARAAAMVLYQAMAVV